METAHLPAMGVTGPSIPSSHPFRKRYTFRDVWNAMATERDFDYVFWIHITLDLLFDGGIRYFGYVLVVVAMFLVTMLGSSGVFIVLPKVSRPGSLGYYAQVMIGKERVCRLGCPLCISYGTDERMQLVTCSIASTSITSWRLRRNLVHPKITNEKFNI